MNNNKFYKISGIIINDNKIIKKNYKSTSDTMFQIASCSKFITSLIVAKLYELNILDYNVDINKYLKKWKCPNKNITLKHLLTHTSGSSDKNGYLGMDPQIYYKQNLQLNIDIITGNSYSKPFNITEKPEEKFIYSGAGYQVIQQVIEEVTGKRLYKLMEQYIFKPLKMKNSTGKLLYENNNYSGNTIADMNGFYRIYPETAAAGVWMSCNDLAILAIDLMNGYNDNKSKILKQDTIKMITKEVKFNWALGMSTDEIEGNKIFGHDGSNFAYKMKFLCNPTKKYIKILMVNHNPKITKNIRSDATNKIYKNKT